MSIRSVSGYPFALAVCVLLLLALFVLLRTQRLREKYSVIWFAVIVGVVLLGFVPSITTWLSSILGVTTPLNLVFILASLVLLTVCIQLSIEISALEESSRTVAEEVALLRLELQQQIAASAGRRTGSPGSHDTAGSHDLATSREPTDGDDGPPG